MKWLALWVLLTGVCLAGRIAIPPSLGERWQLTRQDLAHLAAVPLVQAVALWTVALVRRGTRR